MGPPKKTARQRVLAEWRGVDLKPLELARESPAQSVEQLVGKVLHEKLRIDQRRAEAEIVRVWNALIDPNIVAHARPTGLHKGTLFVSVDTSVWLSEIVRYRRREILERLQHSFGKTLIARISFRLG
ncbi:MAG: DUF721 domain-containing protein [Verrucomicrobia bacterium]|nr:DUF721 domain-containing protein [Verrucomicrobiota bacterium]